MLHLIRPLGFSTDDRNLKRAGLDYWKFVEIVYWDSFEKFLANQQLEKLHFLSKKAQKTYLECRFTPGDFLVFGKETKGLPAYILDNFKDQCYQIRIDNPNIRSLNLAMACGIVLYEARRQLLSSE